jgi:hypothetical protein
MLWDQQARVKDDEAADGGWRMYSEQVGKEAQSQSGVEALHAEEMRDRDS